MTGEKSRAYSRAYSCRTSLFFGKMTGMKYIRVLPAELSHPNTDSGDFVAETQVSPTEPPLGVESAEPCDSRRFPNIPTDPNESRAQQSAQRGRRGAFTYFFQGERGGPVKIGRAINPIHRHHEVQIGHFYKLVIVGLIEADREEELHELCRAYRMQGEWFDAVPEVVGELVRVLDQHRNDPFRGNKLLCHHLTLKGWHPNIHPVPGKSYKQCTCAQRSASVAMRRVMRGEPAIIKRGLRPASYRDITSRMAEGVGRRVASPYIQQAEIQRLRAELAAAGGGR